MQSSHYHNRSDSEIVNQIQRQYFSESIRPQDTMSISHYNCKDIPKAPEIPEEVKQGKRKLKFRK